MGEREKSGILNDQLQSSNVEDVEELNVTTSSNSGVQAARQLTRREKVGGKQKDPVWSNFNEVVMEKNGRTYNIQKCIACEVPVSAKADRLRAHIEKCPKIKEKATLESPLGTSEVLSIVPLLPVNVNNIPSKQMKVSKFVTTTVTTKKEKEELDLKVAKFWFSANLAFNSANLKSWRELSQALRPGYEPPSDYMLQGPLLDTVYNNLRQEMNTALKGKYGTLVQDGWSDIHNSPTLTHTIVCNGDAYLINTIECEADKKTAEYCADKFSDALAQVEAFGFKVVAGSTDNCSVMIKMRDILLERHPDLLLYGCSPHMLNRLCEDVTPKPIVAKINEVSKYFRDHHQPSALLKQKGGLIPQLPASTRWISHLECISVFLKNRTKYIEIGQIEGVCKNSIVETVNSLAIFKNATDLLTQFEEISAALLKLQSDDSNIADATHCWLKLLRSSSFCQYKKNIVDRMDVAVSDFFYVAYLMHPKYQGALLTVDKRNKAMEILLDKSSSFVTVAEAFLAKDGRFFPKASLNEEVMATSHPTNWWLNLKHQEKMSNAFVDYISVMYRCPSSTASVERIFSTYGFIQTDVRNRLSQDKVMKLAFCFRALRQEKEQDVTVSRKRKLLST